MVNFILGACALSLTVILVGGIFYFLGGQAFLYISYGILFISWFVYTSYLLGQFIASRRKGK
jgi:hypothetical protein